MTFPQKIIDFTCIPCMAKKITRLITGDDIIPLDISMLTFFTPLQSLVDVQMWEKGDCMKVFKRLNSAENILHGKEASFLCKLLVVNARIDIKRSNGAEVLRRRSWCRYSLDIYSNHALQQFQITVRLIIIIIIIK